ncbi:hypothetical protein [Actinomadura viridis]|uniref:Energy-coupling factor transporter ATP-binding protein EcfA2 n=1 Tax=Actinomadura viridis TaxID=58110 RepID=A0A931DNI3_9ACTN|nr:hypothetical protein [Actinomadura viridis]MBG6092857.1 energy-coupling factor transporter ATP-binding protein EcfA2 [Actinomadura viridis]
MNAFGNTVDGDLVQIQNRFVRGRPAMYLGPTEIRERIACYVPPRNHEQALKTLFTDHAVLLCGPSGCGRETTAIAALNQLHHGTTIRRFSTDEEESEEITAGGPRGYIIRDADASPSQLLHCVDNAREAGAYLAIIADTADHLHLDLRPIEIEPPNALDVYHRRLAHRRLGPHWSHWDDARDLLNGALPKDARRLAEIAEKIEQRGGTPEAMRAEALQAYRGWNDELSSWFKKNKQPHDQALLVAAATLAPAPENNVYHAAQTLAQQLDITVNGAGLAWVPLAGVRTFLKADPGKDSIAFSRHGYADSVLQHVWADYPLSRPALLTWLADLPTDPDVPEPLAKTIAARFADLAAEHGDAKQITRTALRWAEADKSGLAYIALARTCLHPVVGGRIRTQLYEWSRTARAHQSLKLTIARVCQTLGDVHPSIALTRLKHLITYGNVQILNEVATVILALAEEHRREVLKAILTWCSDSPERLSPTASQRRKRAGAVIFLRLAQPPRPSLFNGSHALSPRNCLPAWQAAFRHTPETTFQSVLHHWLDTALLNPQLRDQLVETLRDAARPWVEAPQPLTHHPIVAPDTARILIDNVRRWAALHPSDRNRRAIRDDIVIPLLRPWLLRIVFVLWVWLRTTAETIRSG